MKKNKISLLNFPIQSNIEFISKLYEEEDLQPQAIGVFYNHLVTKKIVRLQELSDENVSLDDFIKKIFENKNTGPELYIGYPKDQIQVSWRTGQDPPYAYELLCHWSRNKDYIISKIFEESYGIKILDIPTSESVSYEEKHSKNI